MALIREGAVGYTTISPLYCIAAPQRGRLSGTHWLLSFCFPIKAELRLQLGSSHKVLCFKGQPDSAGICRGLNRNVIHGLGRWELQKTGLLHQPIWVALVHRERQAQCWNQLCIIKVWFGVLSGFGFVYYQECKGTWFMGCKRELHKVLFTGASPKFKYMLKHTKYTCTIWMYIQAG